MYNICAFLMKYFYCVINWQLTTEIYLLERAEEDGPLLSNQSFRAYMKGTCDACYKVTKLEHASNLMLSIDFLS